MNSSILIFTFSPVQSFIGEARRAADLYTSSQILVELAKAAANAIGKERLIYPALDGTGNLPADIPNKLVARVPFEEAEQIANKARQALLDCWNGENGITETARQAFLGAVNLPFDESIWERQTSDNYLWEIYWSAARLDERDYREAYKEAEAGLVAAKFTRSFAQYEEPGFKDTLSGKRQALHAKDDDGRKYWYRVGQVEEITPIKIRPSMEGGERPRERLDAIGVVKRFHPELSGKKIPPFHGFPSTSSIAAWSFLESAQKYAPELLANYHQEVRALLSEKKYRVRDDDFWRYDGDLLYIETLRIKRMKDDYGKSFTEANLQPAARALEGLYAGLRKLRDEFRKKGDPRHKEIPASPSPYYAIIVLDGDGMGEYLRTLDEQGHHKFSKALYDFSSNVNAWVGNRGRVVYNGGDDVLAFAPLSFAVPLAAELASRFKSQTGRSASAGIAITHHLSPLGTALEAARHAEHAAKSLKDKDAVCVLVLKRSGDPIQTMSKWDALKKGDMQAGLFANFVEEFQGDDLSSKLPYDLSRSAYAIPTASKMLQAELYRLVNRHLQNGSSREKEKKAKEYTGDLFQWAGTLDKTQDMNIAQHLAQWLALARFVAKGGDA